jgi:hypothetical protein
MVSGFVCKPFQIPYLFLIYVSSSFYAHPDEPELPELSTTAHCDPASTNVLQKT